MTKFIDVILLAKSVKRRCSCVAGILPGNGNFICLVSPDEGSHGALKDEDMRCGNGYICQPLDKVRVPLIGPKPIPHQPENWLIDTSQHWQLVEHLSQAKALATAHINTNCKIFNTKGYSVSERFMPQHPEYSLQLYEVEELIIRVLHKPVHAKPAYKACFKIGGYVYNNMSMTDPDYYYMPDGFIVGMAAVLMSLPDVPFESNNEYYKFIAKIFPL